MRGGNLTSAALTSRTMARIRLLNPVVCAFNRVTEERAFEDAERADREIKAGIDRGPMHGIPYALKDIYATAGIPTTCCSALLLDNVPVEDAAVEERLRAGGGVLVGKLTTHEFALGGPGFDLPFPPARNPWDLERFTGGSSSGSGAAVAAGMVPVALGSDTGGSIRSPASHCGVVGLKPTYGLVSRRGCYPLSYSLDHCGPLAWSVEDAALALGVIAGHDPLDPSSVDRPATNYTFEINLGIHGLRIGYIRDFVANAPGVDPEVVSLMDASAALMERLGASVEEVMLPDFELFKACGRIIMTAEAYAIHENDLKTRPRAFGRYMYQRVAPAALLTAADLIQAHRLRRELTVAVDKVLRRYDALITTTAIQPASRLDEFPRDWPPPSSAVAVQTVPFNVTGHPALSVPAGFSQDGLPLGLQIIGRPFAEATIFRIAAAFEAGAGVSYRRPKLKAASRSEATDVAVL
ncbi:amidase [Mesorhizobium sp. LSHC414A00]|nr:amidase [Mesorhizobium sp. LSHC414A00]